MQLAASFSQTEQCWTLQCGRGSINLHSTAYLSKMLFSIDPKLTMTPSRHGTVKFNVMCVPIAPCETTVQGVLADQKDTNGNTTAGSSVKGG